MGWFKDKFSAEPIDCPRGWGQVSFVRKLVLVPPIFVIGRRCPIGGVEHCRQCRYQVNPVSADLLRVQLQELEELRGGTLSDAEFRIRRRLIIAAKAPPPGIPGQRAGAAALVLGPLGVVTVGAGWYLSAAVHVGFLGLLGGGLVLSALAVGFAGLSRFKRRTLPSPDDPLFDDVPEDTRELEDRLERAQEELGFFRELHESEPAGELGSQSTHES